MTTASETSPFYPFSITPRDKNDESFYGSVIIYARDADEALAHCWLANEFESPETELVVTRLSLPPVTDGSREARDDEYFAAGWREEGSPVCVSCGRAGFGLEVCEACSQCGECGCACYDTYDYELTP